LYICMHSYTIALHPDDVGSIFFWFVIFNKSLGDRQRQDDRASATIEDHHFTLQVRITLFVTLLVKVPPRWELADNSAISCDWFGSLVQARLLHAQMEDAIFRVFLPHTHQELFEAEACS
jgi:hypothetical protein